MDPVRSSTTTTSTGRRRARAAGVRVRRDVEVTMPKSFANQVFVLAVAVTVRLFGLRAALHPKPRCAAVVQDVV